MTSVKPPIEEASTGQPSVSRNGLRALIATILALAVMVIALGAWIAYDQTTQAAVPTEIEQLLDDYLAAWEARDEAAFRSVVTEDFVINEYIYHDDPIRGFGLSEHIRGDIDAVVNLAFNSAWTNEQVGDPIVTGEGPWFVSVEENWQGTAVREEGQANYTIVEVDGVLKIANHYWAGLILLGRT